MRFFSLLFFLGLIFPAQAVMVSDLYEVQVGVADQLAQSRQAALQEALQQVIVKATGSTLAVQNPSIQAQNSQAERYVKSFRYSKNPIDNSLMLDVVFAQDLLEKLLRQANLPIWSKSRPLILLWQGVEENGTRRALGQDTGRWQLLFEQAFNERGLPLLWPNQDREDNLAFPPTSQWTLSTQDAEQAAKRYMANAQVIGRLVARGNSFTYQGVLLLKNERLELSASANDPLSLTRQVANQLAQFMAERYAVGSGSAQGLQIEVTGVRNFRQYQDLLVYLKGNIAVKQLRLIEAQGQSLRLELELSAPWEQVWSMLALDKRLKESDQPLVYQWQH